MEPSKNVTAPIPIDGTRLLTGLREGSTPARKKNRHGLHGGVERLEDGPCSPA